tara:strand:+ start:208 stop:645 length:438 start_codon:yes stop_codon:yes gene_type:complete
MSLFVGRIVTWICLIGVAAFVWVESDQFPANGHQLPQFCAIVAICIMLLMLLKEFKNIDKKKVKMELSYQANKHFVIFLFSIFYVISIFFVGYYVSTILFIIFGCLLVGVRQLKTIFITTVVTLPLMYAFFELFLQAGLPRGWLI